MYAEYMPRYKIEIITEAVLEIDELQEIEEAVEDLLDAGYIGYNQSLHVKAKYD